MLKSKRYNKEKICILPPQLEITVKMSKNNDFKRTLITTALPYANGPVHIGHLAGVYVPADVYARFLRLNNEDVLLVGGSDEHGVPITIKAKAEGVTPQDIVDRYHNIIKDSFEKLGVSFDVYGRTTSATHRATASEFFKTLNEKGEFIKKTTSQLFDPEAGQFLADRYVTGTCPHCGNTAAYGDQCEKCGTSLSPTDLINPKSALTGAEPVMKETTHWFLPLDKWEPRLKQWILEEHKEWRPNVYGQCKSWLDTGLQPRAVSRDLDWGIPVPAENAEGKVLYVWFDAPIGYISNTKDCVGKDWELWWKDKETKMVHFIGKDNIVFHCIVFPAMLMADGTYNLPENVPANEFLNLEDDKISTSRNWAVWLHEYLEELPDRQDELRYVLTANAPETKDNNFTWKDFQTRVNSELVAILGNFVNRTNVLLHKYYSGIVPEPGDFTPLEKDAETEIKSALAEMEHLIREYKFRDALREAMNVARVGNKYLADAEPWKVIKTDPERVKTIMYFATQICANLVLAFESFIPLSMKKLAESLRMKDENWADAGRFDLIKPGTLMNQLPLLFEKIEDAVVEAQLNKLIETKKKNMLQSWKPDPVKEEQPIDVFDKVDIRVGKVLACEKVKKSKKLLRFLIDDGEGERTILSGIAQYYEPDALVGKEVCFIANLPARPMMGIESHGMILSARNADGSLVVITPSGPVQPGATVG